MKKLIVLTFFLLSISLVSAICSENQIDINTATAEELIKIIYIREVRAEDLRTLRPFEYVDNLVEIYGIGEKTLGKIKEQALACVNTETEKIKEVTEIKAELIKEDVGIKEEFVEEDESEEDEKITLTAKTIKSQDNKENKSNYAVWACGILRFARSFICIKTKKI